MTDRREAADAQLTELLGAWRRDITEVPMPSLVDPDHAVDVVIEALRRSRVHAPPDGACTRPRNQGLKEAPKDTL
ncbi:MULTISPECIES: hypothetical protein [unclassified Amycolatopsis]|uniref:hypothetical protein n=1 Tax=unclassified Amycolatopsis TaxID=2618356 RepID=UPI001FF1AAF7|nr:MULTISPECIES: hypothetical protein [unclassified Amycolatopsis]UOZ08176.1 hypothetical protein MUY22_07865 [Amycolatopsis sp. WQ 127309]WSJ74439.1 hypothetical protein OG439_34020 [Amycolatopsis sp. NBC_01307]WSK81913.1 hypothetical protein OG570_15650 [Amycolatopsis sp. NBC_01286]